MRQNKVAIVGAGRFGLALAHRIASAGRAVVVWSQKTAVVEEINRDHRCSRLPDVAFAPSLSATGDPEELARDARFIVVAVSAAAVRERVRQLGEVINGSHMLVHALGVLVSPGDIRVSRILAEETPALRVGALAGPALWSDLLAGSFASLVVASHFDEVTREGRRLLGVPPALRVYRGSDLAGVELAAALAGAFTVAVGMSDGLGMGPGPRSVLITRALAEAARLGDAYGAEARTFTGLAGLGNLLVRAQSEQWRDYRLGLALARGETPDGPEMASEGAQAAFAAVRLAERHSVRVPVLHAVSAVLAGRLEPAKAANAIADTVAAEE
ncbi:MAG: NAD(P)-binding domain-containing protein [Proteobacteria bacterium]|nr:NAD(P)-binding domain-containing protein [Pseudomonadota bacterium]